MAEERRGRALTLLQQICEQYQDDTAKFYMDEKRRRSGKFNFQTFARKIFDAFPQDQFPRLYIDLFEAVPYLRQFDSPPNARPMMPVAELLLNMFASYQLPAPRSYVPPANANDGANVSTGCDHTTETDSQAKPKNIRKKRRSCSGRKGPAVCVGPRITLTTSHAIELVKLFLPIPLHCESKLWKQIKYVLIPNGNTESIKKLSVPIIESIQNGRISFSALSFFMRDPIVSPLIITPQVILQALYIGPLSSSTVEFFAMNRSKDFRNCCRESLRSALHAQQDQLSFRSAAPPNLPENHRERLSYRDFSRNVVNLLKDLRGEPQGRNEINMSWACAAIKKYGMRTYEEKSWKVENYYDLVWTIMAQRPNLKKFICDTLEKQFNDAGAARYWRKMQPHQMNPTKIQNKNIAAIDPLKYTENYLNFPECVKAIEMVSTDAQIKALEQLIRDRLADDSTLYVGLDAEWSSYLAHSKASILQFALYDRVYIIDIDSGIHANNMKNFLTFLFLHQKIVKIGFQFGEDLHQLRSAHRSCTALYNPKNVVCIGKIIAELLDKLDKREDAAALKKVLLPYMGADLAKVEAIAEEAEESMESVEIGWTNQVGSELNGGLEGDEKDTSILSDNTEGQKEDVESAEENKNGNVFTNKGLAQICEKMLGSPLDKTEQCSVWDRRPLRPLQMRYAAMDAYCMLLLFDVCRNLAKGIDVDFDDLVRRQPHIQVSLPLLSEAPL